MKKILWFIGFVVVVGVGYWLISPLFFDKEIDDSFDATTEAAIDAAIEEFREETQNTNIDDQIDEEKQEEMFEEIIKIDQEVVVTEPMPVEDTTDEKIEEEETKEIEVKGNVDIVIKEEPKVLLAGEFVTVSHNGSGQAKIIDLGGDKGKILRFENLDVENGPDLRVILSPNSDVKRADDLGAKIELAKLKGNKGTQNYIIPEDVDVNDYKSVIIYCKPFRVVFNAAELK